MSKASVLYFNQWYFELIKCLSSEVVVDSHILEMQYLLIIGSFPTVRFCFRNIFSQEVPWFLVLLIREAVRTETLLLSLPCPAPSLLSLRDSVGRDSGGYSCGVQVFFFDNGTSYYWLWWWLHSSVNISIFTYKYF